MHARKLCSLDMNIYLQPFVVLHMVGADPELKSRDLRKPLDLVHHKNPKVQHLLREALDMPPTPFNEMPSKFTQTVQPGESWESVIEGVSGEFQQQVKKQKQAGQRNADVADALRKMAYVLRNLVCTGTTTNQDFLLKLVEHPDVIAGKYNTHFISEQLSKLTDSTIDIASLNISAIATTLFRWHYRNAQRKVLRSLPSGWRNSFYSNQFETYAVGEENIRVEYRSSNNKF